MKYLKYVLLISIISLIYANELLPQPKKIDIKKEILKTKEFKPYCSDLLQGNCFIFSNIYFLGFSKDGKVAYIVKDALDTEDDGEAFRVVVQNLKTNKKIYNILYRYDTVDINKGSEFLSEKIIDLDSNTTLQHNRFHNSIIHVFKMFYKRQKKNIATILDKYRIKYSPNLKLIEPKQDVLHVKPETITYHSLFPGEKFLKSIQVYSKSNKIVYSRKFSDYFYISRIVGEIPNVMKNTNVYILASIKRGATGAPHLVELNLFGSDSVSRAH